MNPEASPLPKKSAEVLGISLSGTTKEGLLWLASEKIARGSKFLIVTPNPEIVVLAQKDTELAKIINGARVSLPDGVGLLQANKLLNKKSRAADLNRIKGREAFLWLLELSNRKKYKVFFLGGRSGVIKKSIEKVRRHYPNIKIDGHAGPHLDSSANPVTQIDNDVEREVVSILRRRKPDLLFIAFGAPKQEKWAAKWMRKLPVKGVMVVGGTLDVFSGVKTLPPHWMAEAGLEWLWRLAQEPSRLPRVVNAVLVFPLFVARHSLRRALHSVSTLCHHEQW